MNTNLTQPELSKLKQKELKDICQEKGLPISGKKSISGVCLGKREKSLF